MIDFKGTVERGHSRGKRLGFPTLNMKIVEEIPEGIYVSRVGILGVVYNGLTFIGAAKTYGETDVWAETYVFDFDKEVYGEEVEVTLLEKLRGNEKLDSEESLITQMEQDKRQAIEYFRNR